MQQPKKPREVRHCPRHGGTELKRRRGRQSHKWIWFCPLEECNYSFKGSKS